MVTNHFTHEPQWRVQVYDWEHLLLRPQTGQQNGKAASQSSENETNVWERAASSCCEWGVNWERHNILCCLLPAERLRHSGDHLAAPQPARAFPSGQTDARDSDWAVWRKSTANVVQKTWIWQEQAAFHHKWQCFQEETIAAIHGLNRKKLHFLTIVTWMKQVSFLL